MKKVFIALIASIAFGATVSLAADFVDYGVDANGNQCFDEKDETGQCDLIYSTDRTLIGDSNSFDVSKSVKIAQPKAPSMKELIMAQKAKKNQICKIIWCPKM